MPVLEQKTGPLYPEILAIMRRYNLNVASAFQCGKMTMATPLANTRNLRMHPPPYPGGDSRPDPFWASQPGHHECCCSVVSVSIRRSGEGDRDQDDEDD
ncbi:hypothetical protein N7534_005002 [Penicillium rubens]|nr:hypothetical protein N7534_005002 [Penicillium rubens]